MCLIRCLVLKWAPKIYGCYLHQFWSSPTSILVAVANQLRSINNSRIENRTSSYLVMVSWFLSWLFPNLFTIQCGLVDWIWKHRHISFTHISFGVCSLYHTPVTHAETRLLTSSCFVNYCRCNRQHKWGRGDSIWSFYNSKNIPFDNEWGIHKDSNH